MIENSSLLKIIGFLIWEKVTTGRSKVVEHSPLDPKVKGSTSSYCGWYRERENGRLKHCKVFNLSN